MTSHLGRKPQDPDYGLGEHTLDCDRLGVLGEKELTERLIGAFESPSYRAPRLPAVATELLALSRKPDVEFDALEALLEQDAVLAGEVLSLGRSAFYSRIRRAESLREALVVLGVRKLRDIVFQAAMNLRVFRSASYGYYMERLRGHCQATAHLSQIVSMHTPMSAERSFLCGLLHDVGIAGVLLVLGEVERGKKPPDLAPLWSSIDAAHARAGARMVELWGLAEVAMVVGAHHHVTVDRADHPYAAIVCLGEALATEMGLGFVPPELRGKESEDELAFLAHGGIDRSDEKIIGRARDALGLKVAVLDVIRSEAKDWAQAAGVLGPAIAPTV